MTEIKSELVLQFREWIFTNTRPAYVIKDISKELIEIITEEAVAYIRFYEMNIVELSIVDNKTKENIFYIHFQVNDLQHAEDLFNEMIQVLLSASTNRHIKVLLCCTSGLTTGFFAEKLNESAKMLSLNTSFDAVSYDKVFTEGLKYDLILLAPQAGYLEKKIREAMDGIPVAVIPASIFGTYDTGAVLQLVQQMLEERKPEETAAEKVSKAFENVHKILVICVFNSARHIRICYRYYKNGNIETGSEVVKPKINVTDIFDILDTMLALYPEIECVGLSMPGTARFGHLYLPTQGFNNENIADAIKKRYGVICVLSNDANAVVQGIYALQDHYHDIIFHYQPYGYIVGGEGIVIDGKVVKGYKNRTGEIGGLTSLLKYDYPGNQLGKTPEATYDLLARELSAVNSVIAPEAIFVHASLASDIEVLKKEMLKYVEPQYLPDLYYLKDLNEYMMVGTMLRSLEWMDYEREIYCK